MQDFVYSKNHRVVHIVVQLLSSVQLFVTSWTAAHQASLSFIISQSLLKLISIDSVMPFNHLILYCPLLLLPSIFPSIRVFQMSWLFTSGGQRIGVSASVSVLPMNIQDWFLLDWFDLLAVQGTLKSLLQHNNSKASILQWSTFFTVQLSHLYMTTGKTIALTIWIFVGKVMSLLFNMLSRFFIAFLPRNKCLLISWLQPPSAVEPKKIKFVAVSPSICREVMGPDAMNFIDWMLSFKPAFSLSSFPFIKRLFSSSLHQPLWSSNMSWWALGDSRRIPAIL